MLMVNVNEKIKKAEVVENEEICVTVRADGAYILAIAKKTVDNRLDFLFFAPGEKDNTLYPVRLEDYKKIPFSQKAVSAYVKKIVECHGYEMVETAREQSRKSANAKKINEVVDFVDVSVKTSTSTTPYRDAGKMMDLRIAFRNEFYEKYLQAFDGVAVKGGVAFGQLVATAMSEKIC